VERVLDAVVRIGCRHVGALALTTINPGGADADGSPVLNEGALATARAARMIGRMVGCSNADCESLFVAGLFSGAGATALVAEDPGYLEWRAGQLRAGVDDTKLLRREQMAYGIDHVLAASRQLDEWNMPTSIIEVVSSHHDPRNHTDRVLVAAMMVVDRTSAARCHVGSFAVEMEAIGLDQHVDSVREEALRYVQAVMSTSDAQAGAPRRPMPVPNLV
jgi:HD-like signal output (HDOD) protein